VGRTAAVFEDMKTWTDRLGHTSLRSFTDKDHHFWLEQNPAKRSKWAKLAREGHEMAWEFKLKRAVRSPSRYRLEITG
jgi:hypothetical protein